MGYKINHDNIKEWAKNYDGPLFDGIFCDPPYELGFMGKSWDSSGIAFDVDMWKDIYKLLKPGGHLLAFSGSRTYHRMAVAIEDAGFEIRDQFIWMYGSGFPKSLNIGKAVDKIQGNERVDLGYNDNSRTNKPDVDVYEAGIRGKESRLTKGTSEWEGYGTALKPAHEPCVLARKPIEGTVANNVLTHGTGGLNIDGTRIPLNGVPKTKGGMTGNKSGRVGYMVVTDNGFKSKVDDSVGRFPANLIHDGSDEVEAVFPQTGKSSGGRIGNKGSMINTMGNAYEKGDPGFGDSGSASRYFYCAKSSKRERNAGLEGFKAVVRNDGRNTELASGHMPQNRSNTTKANHHPTVKPLSLTKYLATLIKPPTGGRLLVPFSGSGSEMIGALQAGWEYVEGVELTEEYIPIAEARIKHWVKEPQQQELV